MTNEWLFRAGWSDPFREFRRLQNELARTFAALPAEQVVEYPPMNLWAGEEGVVVSAELPGVDPDQVQVSVHRNTLTLSGRRPVEPPVPEAEALRRERPAGAFTRTVTLPFQVDADKVQARCESGVLVIQLPRPEADRPKRVKIAA